MGAFTLRESPQLSTLKTKPMNKFKLKLSLARVKKDIKEGKSERIYTSSNTLWWTHLEEDVRTASDTGADKMKQMHDKMMKDPRIPKKEKRRMKSLYDMARNGAARIPSDPTGSPLYMVDDPLEWIKAAESNEEHYGKHGFKALMFTHHQNCNGACFLSWGDTNKAIDVINRDITNN